MRDVYVPAPATWWQRLIERLRPSKKAAPLRLVGPTRKISDETASKMLVSHILNATPYRSIDR